MTRIPQHSYITCGRLTSAFLYNLWSAYPRIPLQPVAGLPLHSSITCGRLTPTFLYNLWPAYPRIPL